MNQLRLYDSLTICIKGYLIQNVATSFPGPFRVREKTLAPAGFQCDFFPIHRSVWKKTRNACSALARR